MKSPDQYTAVEFSFPKNEDRAVGHGGCNGFGGMMNTMMACPEVLERERAIP